jgi:hypothetical protein
MSTKNCLDCMEPMNADAKKCPHCQSYQGRFDRLFGSQGGQYANLLFFIFLAFAAYFSGLFSYDPIYNPESDLVITESAFQFDESSCAPDVQRVTLLGTIANQSDVAFKDIVVSVEYYDEAGQLIDVVHEEIYDLIVPPHTSQKFRASSTCSQDESRYAKSKAKITKAEPDRWF